MNTVLVAIQQRQKNFAALPFFRFLEMSNCLEDSRIFVPGLAFFILSFQDVLRINESWVTNPVVKSIVKNNRQDDMGHDAWFLHDLDELGIICDAAVLFGPDCQAARDAAYEVISEIYRASDDRVRLVIPLAIEATGHVFFHRVHHYFSRCNGPKYLRYFSKTHLEIELNHELFEDEVHSLLQSIELTAELEQESLAAVERIFAAISRMVINLNSQIENRHHTLISV